MSAIRDIAPALKREGRWALAISIVAGVLTSAGFGYAAVGWGVAAARQDHLNYIDAHRPCASFQDAVFDLHYAQVELFQNESGEIQENARVNVLIEGTRLHLYAFHAHNSGTGDLRDLRLNLVLPGSAYAVATTRREALVDSSPVTISPLLGFLGPGPATQTTDARLTHDRAFREAEGNATDEGDHVMPSGNRTPAPWETIHKWSPNIANASGNEIVSFTLPVLSPGKDWWVGAWYFQPSATWNDADRGATITAWSEGYQGPLYDDLQFETFEGPARTSVGNLCAWSG